jgi:hypothetical protein
MINSQAILRKTLFTIVAALSAVALSAIAHAQTVSSFEQQYQKMLDGTLAGILMTEQVRALAGDGFWRPCNSARPH